MHHGIDAHQVKKRSFAFTVSYIYCFRTHLVYLSFRHGVFILYTPCHLPPQREPRRLPPHTTDSPQCAEGAPLYCINSVLFPYCCLYFTRKILNKNKLRFNIFRFGANYSSSACSLRRVISRIALGSLAGTEKVNSVYSPSTLCTIRSPLC